MTHLNLVEAIEALKNGKQIEFLDLSLDDEKWMDLDIKSISVDELLDENKVFRIKRKMLTIKGIDYPEPYDGDIKRNEVYYLVDITHSDKFRPINGCFIEPFHFSRGLVHTERENAIAHADAIIALFYPKNQN